MNSSQPFPQFPLVASLDGAYEPSGPSSATLESHLFSLQDRLRDADRVGDIKIRADLELQIARTLVELGRGAEAWAVGRRAFEVFMTAADFESAADVCSVLFLADQPQSQVALGQGIWLGVTYPIDLDLTLELLDQLIESVPAASDAAALAATVCLFLIDLRAEESRRDDLMFFASQTLSRIAHRHGGVDSQQALDLWLERLGLNAPERFMARLRVLVDSLVGEHWWFDRAVLQAELPAGSVEFDATE